MPGWSGCDVCITGFEQIKGGFEISIDQRRRLNIPQSFKVEDIQKAQRDCEILGETLRSKPEEMSALLASLLQNNIDDARQRAHKLGLTEEHVVNQGGGLMWLVVIVVVLYALDAW